MHMSRTGRTVVNKETKTKRLKDENKSSVVFIFLLLWNFFFHNALPNKFVLSVSTTYSSLSFSLFILRVSSKGRDPLKEEEEEKGD